MDHFVTIALWHFFRLKNSKGYLGRLNQDYMHYEPGILAIVSRMKEHPFFLAMDGPNDTGLQKISLLVSVEPLYSDCQQKIEFHHYRGASSTQGNFY